MDKSTHERFHIRSLEELRTRVAELGLTIPFDDDTAILGTPLDLNGRRVTNRFLAQPMEGFDSTDDGTPTELSFRRYARYARGGFGLIWFEATAVLNEGRSNPQQLHIHKGNVDVFRRLVESTRAAADEALGQQPVCVLQLTHSGRYSKPTGEPAPLIAHHSAILDPKQNLPPDYPLVSDDYLDRLQDTYVEAARLAAQAGFDGVDVKSCHRYLVSELLASFTREGRYGGSFENRTRLLTETLARIAADVPGLFITTRMNAYDAISHPFGFGVDREDYRTPDLTEPIALAARLAELGVPLLNVSIGNPYFNPHFGRPYDFPTHGLPLPEDHPLAGLERFIRVTAEIQQSQPSLPIVASGYSWLRQFMPFAAAAAIRERRAALLGIGRGAFAYPDTPRDVNQGRGMDPGKCCVTCSACTQIMRDGGRTGCVVRDSEIYGPEYRRARRLALDHLIEQAQHCRQCESPTCRSGCPARIDVPAFIKAFAEQDIPRAYAILKARNVLPEMCGYVCPSEVQCEGHCVEEIFCEHPVPIQDIQLVTCQIARRRGLTAVDLPEAATGKRIAIIGGGPAGVAAAIRLLEMGHEVAIYDRSDRLGGTPDGIIPDDRYRHARQEVDAILAPALEAGRIMVHTGQDLGTDFTLAALQRDHDAVLAATGLDRSSTLGKAQSVMDALLFLSRVKNGDISDVPEKIAVLGGGNTAMDAACVAAGLGATDVYLVYRRSFKEMPAWPSEREKFMQLGGHCLILHQPIGYETGAGGQLTGLRMVRTELGQPDASGRRKPVPVAGSESVLGVGMVIEAIGQGVSDTMRAALAPVEFGPDGLVKTAGDSLATSVDGIFVAGDILNGGTTAVQGIAEGMRAAEEINAYLESQP